MHISNKKTERHRRLQRLNVLPCCSTCGTVEEHQENACNSEQNEQEEAEATEAQCVTDLDCVTLYLHWVQVIEHRVHDDVRAVTRAVCVALTED